MKYVIIGNGVSGVCASEKVRQFDLQADITMIADETHTPYCRPMIGHILEGAVSPDKLSIRDENFYESLKIKAVLGKRVVDIDVDNNKVITKEQAFPFDRLLIATGADPRPLKANGLNLDNIFYMRNKFHVKQMLKALPFAKNVLVLGGGLVGFKAAYGMCCRQKKVTMLIGSDYPLSMQVDKTAGNMILKELLDHGLKVRVGADVVRLCGNGKVKSAHLSDGTDIACDMVIIGKGVLPSLDFIPKDSISVDLGILVDQYLETSRSGIYAAGDVAELIDISRQKRWVNAIWPEAAAQGRIAGINMTGKKMISYAGSLGRNVIRIFNLDVMSCGIVNPLSDSGYNIISCFEPRLKTYRKLIFTDNILVGFVLINSVYQGGILVSLIQNRISVNIPKEKLIKPSFNFKSLMMIN